MGRPYATRFRFNLLRFAGALLGGARGVNRGGFGALKASGLFLLFGVLAGCPPNVIPATDSGLVESATTTTGDCEDGARDGCDGIDNDCDGVVDEDEATVFYRDADSDNFGTSTVTYLSCDSSVPGYVSDYTDCSDVDPDVHPGALEYCDGVDHDCDGEILEDRSIDVILWYGDLDEDGYGGTSTYVNACVGPEGYVINNDDCDDGDAAIHPGAVEVCDDSDTDEDCNNLADESDDWAASGDPYYPDLDEDRHGDLYALPEWLCEQPDDLVTSNDDCDDTNAAISPSDPEVCNAVDDDCDDEIDEAPGECAAAKLGDTADTGA